MRLHSSAGWGGLLLASLHLTSSWAKKDGPSIKSTSFDFIPLEVSYFEDSDVIIFADGANRNMYRSADAGESWEIVDGPQHGSLIEMVLHPYDHQRAYYLTGDLEHWSTKDRGKTWSKFKTTVQASEFSAAMTFHAGDPDRIIFTGMQCEILFCAEVTYYTTDNFENTKFLRDDTAGCHWAKSTELFTTGNEGFDKDRILCVVRGKFTSYAKDFRLLVSDEFFQKSGKDIQEFEPELEPGRTVQGIVNIAIVKGYLVAAATTEGTDEMALYISDDSIKWHRAIFPHDHKLTEEAYTLLEGTNYSIQLDVMNSEKPGNPMGVLFASNSNGTYFNRLLEHMNRNKYGLVDFEKVTGIQGIVIVNTVDNFEEVDKKFDAQKKIKSKISFDDGRDFHALTVDKKEVHLHSVTDLSNSGRVFSSPAPGILMGVGNTGDYLKKYNEGDLFVSDDAGLTWRKALDGPHKYEFGDQGSILVAIKDDWVEEIRYSINHGKDWSKVDLPHGVRPVQLTTTQDSTSLKFLLEALDNKDPKARATKSFILALDFDDLHESKCDKDKDFEKWYARVDEDNKPMCLMGHKQWYTRRKADSDCFVKDEFHDPEVHSEDCECTDADFECDFNFVRSEDRKDCKKAGPLVIPDGECKDPKGKFKGSSGWRKIPENTCSKGIEKDKPVERDCEDGKSGTAPPADGKIKSTPQSLSGSIFGNIEYIERTAISSGDDETIFMRTDTGVWHSGNAGKSWGQILGEEKIEAIIPHPYFNDMIFFLTLTEKVIYSTDRGKTFRSFKAPWPPAVKFIDRGIKVMNFHPKHKDWIIWIGGRDCPGSGCHDAAAYTSDRGDGAWTTLARYVRKCEFIKETQQSYLVLKGKNPEDENEKSKKDKLIYCEARSKESNEDIGNPWTLLSSTDFFDNEVKHFDNVVDFATMAEFIVVATRDDDHETLVPHSSVDGQTFADAQFPHGFKVDHQKAYTVLDSGTHAVFLHVTVNSDEHNEFGTIIKSNSNGTSFVKSLDYVNRNKAGYVDFEKSFGVEGVAIVNVVANYEDKDFQNGVKKLKTMITHNDGAEWDYIKPPKKDADGKDFGCGSNLKKCSLHIHGYTERLDKSHTYSSSSAYGLMLGTGSVGEYLSDVADTFMTSDGGISWKFVKKGKYMWEYGDQGSIVVIVQNDEAKATKVLYYSLDEGDSWKEYEFSSEEMHVAALTTVPSDNSRNFLLWGRVGDKLTTINVDFSGLTDKQCVLDESDAEGDDYYLWTPKHPLQDDDCLFGHIAQYHRKKISSECYNGRMIPHLHDIAKNCSCTRRDFECDFNYERQTDGSCALVPGFQPPDHSLTCKLDDNQVEYYEPTGYRRIPMTTCENGKEMDKITPKPCDGHKDQFEKKHGVSGIALFFAIVIPFAAAGGIGWWVWKNWAGKFGQIRLGEQSSFDSEAPYIKYPVLAIAGLVAVAQALPLLAASLWRSASGALGRGTNRRFTTRDSFARGRGDYAVVDEDEGELLGEDSDEEV